MGPEPLQSVLLHIGYVPDGLLPAPGPAGRRQGRDLGRGLGAGAQPALLPAAGEQRLPLGNPLLFDIQGPDALGGPDLVAADGHQVGAQTPGGEGHL